MFLDLIVGNLVSAMNANWLAFIDENLRNGPGRTCETRLLTKPKSIDRISRRCAKLNTIIIDLNLNAAGGYFSAQSYPLFDGLVYKFGSSARHQKFWRNALRIYAELKRINQHKPIDYLRTFVKTLEKAGHSYAPTQSAVFYLGSLILERIIRLDRLRIHCFRTADASMGYVELGHLLTFNLMLIAIASDVAKEAAIEIRFFLTVYDTLAKWLRLHSERFPIASSDIFLASINVRRANPIREQKLHEVSDILRLLHMNDELGATADNDDFEERLKKVGDLLVRAMRKTQRIGGTRFTSARLVESRAMEKSG